MTKDREPFLAYSSIYSVGHKEIDDDHKHLFDIVNDLYGHVISGEQNIKIDKTLIELSEYTSYHFSREEYIMHHIRYPHAEEHLKEHEKLIQQLSDIIFHCEKGLVTITADTLVFIKSWLVNHTGSSDLRLGVYIQAVNNSSGQPRNDS